MKLFGKFSEFMINDISLYAVPYHSIKTIIDDAKNNPKAEIIIKEYKPRTFTTKTKGNDEMMTIIHQDQSYRHQIKIINDLGFAKITLYSTAMSAESIEMLGLKPIDNVIKKEKTVLAVEKLVDEKPDQDYLVTTYKTSYRRGTKIKRVPKETLKI